MNGCKSGAEARTDGDVYRLPPRFYWDHVSRELPAGRVVRETKRHVYVELDRATWRELVSDANHYAHSMGEGGFDDRGLILSARATLKALAPVDERPPAEAAYDPMEHPAGVLSEEDDRRHHPEAYGLDREQNSC